MPAFPAAWRARLWLLLPIVLLAPALQGESISLLTLKSGIVDQRLEIHAKKNVGRGRVLESLFRQAGCPDSLMTEQHIRGFRSPNIICVLPGRLPDVILVGAHYDKVNIGDGIVDNWSGASLLPDFYQSLAGHPREFTFVFVGFTGEERGLIGSSYYLNHLNRESRAHLRVMVNVDSLGLSPTKVWVNRSDKHLLQLFVPVARSLHLPLQGVNVGKVGDTDSRPFYRHHIPVIDFHSITQKTLSILHTSKDNLSAINTQDYYDSYRLISVYLAFLDTNLNKPPSGSAMTPAGRH